nr:histidine kinase [Ottowia sp.]
VLRIVQEVLTNIVKHSGARTITLRTAPAARGGVAGVQVQVIDDGRPFTPPAPEARQPGRKGLGNVQARAQALGAQVDWAPQAGGGNVFTLWLPLQGPGEVPSGGWVK